MAPRPQGRIAAAALGIVQHSHPRPVEDSVAQPDLGSVAHNDETALATALGHRSHPGEGPKGGVISAADRPGSLGEQGREGDRADPGQRTQNGYVAGSTILSTRLGLAQGRAELLEFACRLMCVFRAKSAANSGMKSATDSDLISAIPI